MYPPSSPPSPCAPLDLAGTLTCALTPGPTVGDTNFLEWLNATVADAARAADQHEALKRVIRELRAGLEARYDLAAVQVRTQGPWLEC